MVLFEDKVRTNPREAAHSESTYAFLDRVDDSVFDRIRKLLNGWLAAYAKLHESSVRDLAGRLRSKRPLQFEGAFWELYLHEGHRRLGFEIEVRPPGSNRRRHPDFLMTRGDDRFYLEATIAGANPGLPRLASGSAQVYDWINSAYDPDFFVRAEVLEAGQETPKRPEVTEPLKSWLQTLDWRPLRDAVESGIQAEFPVYRVAIRDWVLEFEAYPKAEKHRGMRSFPMIGLYTAQAAWQPNVAAALRSKIDEKATGYGRLDNPYVVSVHDITPFGSRGTVNEALFGLDRPYWSDDAGAANRASALLTVADFGLSSIARKAPELWLNPYAEHHLRDGVLPWPVVSPTRSGMEVRAMMSPEPADLFGLPDDWPGKPFRRR